MIESNYIWTGGSSTGKVTCTQCGAGYYQNDATNPTAWVTQCWDESLCWLN